MRVRSSTLPVVLVCLLSLSVGVSASHHAEPAAAPPTSGADIRERIEYQLFFKTLQLPQDPAQADYQEQKAGFDALGLSANDAKALATALLSFRDHYHVLQQQVENGSKHTTADAIAFSNQVDAFVDSTRAELKKTLSPAGVKAIERVISGDEELKRRADQYVRWRGLRELQAQNESKNKDSAPASQN
jgi:hypothetical protein